MTLIQSLNRSQRYSGINKRESRPMKPRDSLPEGRLTRTGTVTRFCHVLLIALAAFAVNTSAWGQEPEFHPQVPEDQTVKPGQRLFMTGEVGHTRGALTTPRLVSFTFIKAYRGVHPDTSDPLPDSALTSPVALSLIFTPDPLTETTQFWWRACTSFGCADSRTFTVFVESDELPVPQPFEGAEDLGDDWWHSPWFGDFNVAFSDSGWIFHAQHQWLFIWEDSSAVDVYLFDQSSDQWLYTAAETYPNLYSFVRNSWVFYFDGTSGPREFVDLQTSDFFTMP